MCTLGYVLGNMEEGGAVKYEGTTNFVEQKQVEWKRTWSGYGDVTLVIVLVHRNTCNKLPWVPLTYHTKKETPVCLNYI